jgi:hypothetical protein
MDNNKNIIPRLVDVFTSRVSFNEVCHIFPLFRDFLNGRDITVIRTGGFRDSGWRIKKGFFDYFIYRHDLDSWIFEVIKDDMSKIFRVQHLKMSLLEKDHNLIDELINLLNINIPK